MAAESTEQIVRHTCNPDQPGQPLPFGRKAPLGQCPRCDQLHAGAPARTSPRWAAVNQRRASEAAHLADLRAHFASERHRSGGCGVACTFGEW